MLSACLFTARPNNASSPLPGDSSEPSSTQDSESDSAKESANGTDQGIVKPWNPSRETILQGSLKDASKGLTLNIGTDYERGPNGIAAIGKDDILILDSAASRIQRYQNGQYYKTYPLPNGEEYLKMKLWEQNLFVLGRNSLCMLNLSSGQITSISLPKTDYGALCSAMVIHSGRLLLLSETAGNYELDPEYGTIKTSFLSYSMIRMESLGVETCCFNLPEGYWMIPAADKYMELLGTDENRSIILCATKKDTPKEMPGCCSILGFDHAGHALGEIALDLTETAFFTAGGDVCVGKDEGIYVLYVFVDHFTVQRIDTK